MEKYFSLFLCAKRTTKHFCIYAPKKKKKSKLQLKNQKRKKAVKKYALYVYKSKIVSVIVFFLSSIIMALFYC